jgi:hypothetical protein
MFELTRRYHLLRAAEQREVEPNRNWPNDKWTIDVQALGGAFSDEWKRESANIREMVENHPALFPDLHVADKKGVKPDPTEYRHRDAVMLGMEGLAGGD